MAKNKGIFQFAANFEVKVAEALDPRLVAASKADLINKDNWPSDGDTIYVYKGLIVDCGDDGVYRLLDPAKALDADYSGWQRIDAGDIKLDTIFAYKGNVETFEALPENPNVGDVYNVESDFSISVGELGDVKEYPAGTNVAWDGEEWNPLSGALDLSVYATKSEVSTIRTDVAANADAVSNLSIALGETNAEIAKKVNAVEGSSLISSEKLALIDANAKNISELRAVDDSLNARLSVIESSFTGGGEIDLSGLNSLVTEQGSKIAVLEVDNANNKSAISEAKNSILAHSDRLAAIELLNTEQSNQISGLTTRVSDVEKHGESITNLTLTVNGHTQDISDIKSSISGLAVKSVKAGEKVLAADAEGALSTSIKLGYDAENKKIQLKGIADAVIDELDATVFIKDGMLDEASYDTATKEIVLKWNLGADKEEMRIPMGSLVDTYTAGSGLKVINNEFSVVLDTNANNKLKVTEGGLLVDIAEDLTLASITLENKMDTKISDAFSWNIVE